MPVKAMPVNFIRPHIPIVAGPQIRVTENNFSYFSTKTYVVSTHKNHNAVTPVRLKPATPRSRVKHSSTEPLLPLYPMYLYTDYECLICTII